jgi:hypothetical protein
MLLFLFTDFYPVVFEMAVVPVDDIGRDIVEVIIIDAIVRGFLVENQLLRLAGLFLEIKRLLLRGDGIAFHGDKQYAAR